MTSRKEFGPYHPFGLELPPRPHFHLDPFGARAEVRCEGHPRQFCTVELQNLPRPACPTKVASMAFPDFRNSRSNLPHQHDVQSAYQRGKKSVTLLSVS